MIYKHSSTIGFRHYPVTTCCLNRKFRTVDVEGCSVRIKESFYKGNLVQRKAEHDDCVAVAEEKGMTLVDVRTRALGIAHESDI